MTRNLFVHDMKKWQTNCRSHEIDHAQVHEYENALILPLRQKPEFNTPEGVYEGGVCSENFTFIAGAAVVSKPNMRIGTVTVHTRWRMMTSSLVMRR